METQIQELSKAIHKNAQEKGFWEEPVNIAEKLMLVVSELSEALEADRKKVYCRTSMLAVNGWVSDEDFCESFKKHVKDTFEDEIADAIIRLLDLCQKLNIPIEAHIEAKMRYNSTRPYKHGKAY